MIAMSGETAEAARKYVHWLLRPVLSLKADLFSASNTSEVIACPAEACFSEGVRVDRNANGGFKAMNANAGWTIESWNAFWSAPSIEIARTRVPSVVHPDVIGYWPRQKPIHGVTDYLQRIVDILTMVPDLRLKLEEHASNGEYTFARWSARGTGPSGRFDITGCDR